MNVLDPRKIITDYLKGRSATGEVVIRLAQAAVEHVPETFAAEVPDQFLAELRELSARPRVPRIFPWFTFVGPNAANDWEAECRCQSERFETGLRVWRAYFADAASHTG